MGGTNPHTRERVCAPHTGAHSLVYLASHSGSSREARVAAEAAAATAAAASAAAASLSALRTEAKCARRFRLASSRCAARAASLACRVQKWIGCKCARRSKESQPTACRDHGNSKQLNAKHYVQAQTDETDETNPKQGCKRPDPLFLRKISIACGAPAPCRSRSRRRLIRQSFHCAACTSRCRRKFVNTLASLTYSMHEASQRLSSCLLLALQSSSS